MSACKYLPPQDASDADAACAAPRDRRLSLVALALLGLLVALMLAGCGRRGALEPPPGAANAPATTGQAAAADRPFILDPLL